MRKSKNRIARAAFMISAAIFMLTISTITAFADDGDAGSAAWDNVMNFLIPWIGRLGGAVMLIGGIMFGLAFKNDDADGKTRALQTLIAGAIVVAVGVSSSIFLQ